MNFLNPEPRTPNPRHRRGLSIIEATMALLILSFAVGGLVQILAVAASQRRATEIRRLALADVANQAEQIALLSWDELTAEKLIAAQPSAELAAAAPSASLKLTVQDEAGPSAAKRIHISATWTTADGQPVEPVELTLWRHQP
jgi:Tfp pilus assembly protein PilV